MVEDAKAAKQRRLAEALRANLKRRKTAARGKSEGGHASVGATGETAGDADNAGTGEGKD